MNRDNLNPKVWGPPAWKFLDHVVMGYPQIASIHDQVAMSHFLKSLSGVLPCEVCRNNMKTFIRQYPPEFNVSGKQALFAWMNLLKQHIKSGIA